MSYDILDSAIIICDMSYDILNSDTIICDMSYDILEWNIHAHFRGILHCIAWGMPFLMLQLCAID